MPLHDCVINRDKIRCRAQTHVHELYVRGVHRTRAVPAIYRQKTFCLFALRPQLPGVANILAFWKFLNSLLAPNW